MNDKRRCGILVVGGGEGSIGQINWTGGPFQQVGSN